VTGARATFPRRTIHLDFHTGPDVPDVGADFDPNEFADRFARAHVDSVTVFAKCHHGHLYYDTDRAERHPSLPRDLDLLGEQIEALHSRGIKAPIYLSVQVDEYAANQHPEWIALHEDLRQVKRGVGGYGVSAYDAGWQILDMSSPYQDYLADQLDEVLRRYAPVDGIFLDMCWDQPSSSKWAVDGMRRSGLDPRDPADRDRYARQVALQYMDRYRSMVEGRLAPTAVQGTWFNSRPKTNLHEEAKLLRHVEIEALPTGGWGYAYLPYVARFVRPLGLPTLSHTGRFHTHWGDNAGLKPRAALKYECCQILSLGLTNGVGDLLHPRGVPSEAVYDLIGSVYEHVEACEPHLEGGTLVSEVAVVVDPELGDDPGPSGIGTVRALQQLRQQFDLVPPEADLSEYRLVLVPEATRVTPALAERLRTYLDGGGSVVVVGDALLDDAGEVALPELGIEVVGESPFTHTFLRPLAGGRATGGLDHVVYERGLRVRPLDGAEVLYGVVEPYFERSFERFSGHQYTPPNGLSEWAAVVRNGNAVSIAVPLLESFGRHANEQFRRVLGEVLDTLLPDPLLRAGGPAHLETTVTRTPSATVVNLLSFVPTRAAEGLDLVQDPFPLVDVQVAVRVQDEPSRVMLQPEGRELSWELRDGYVTTRVTVPDGHALLVIED
jgi:hypothetical protein